MRMKSLLVTTLAALITATSFAFPTAKMPARPHKAAAPFGSRMKHANPGTVKVKGYSYKNKAGKTVSVKPHDRRATGMEKPGMVKVKGYTYKTKTGKTVTVKAHERKAPSKSKGAMKKMKM